MLHIFLHFAVPLGIVFFFFRQQWLVSWLWLLAGFIIDIDHLLADPIYDADRCSIGFHPLHSWIAMTLYGAVLLSTVRWPHGVWRHRTQLFMCGIVVHLILDALDCVF